MGYSSITINQLPVFDFDELPMEETTWDPKQLLHLTIMIVR